MLLFLFLQKKLLFYNFFQKKQDKSNYLCYNYTKLYYNRAVNTFAVSERKYIYDP